MPHPPKTRTVINHQNSSLTPELQQAIASLRLEGIALSDQSLADLALFSQGQLTKKDVLDRVLARVRKA